MDICAKRSERPSAILQLLMTILAAFISCMSAYLNMRTLLNSSDKARLTPCHGYAKAVHDFRLFNLYQYFIPTIYPLSEQCLLCHQILHRYFCQRLICYPIASKFYYCFFNCGSCRRLPCELGTKDIMKYVILIDSKWIYETYIELLNITLLVLD